MSRTPADLKFYQSPGECNLQFVVPGAKSALGGSESHFVSSLYNLMTAVLIPPMKKERVLSQKLWGSSSWS